MHHILIGILSFPLFSQDKIQLIIHGGAGIMNNESLDISEQKKYSTKLNEALELGYKKLELGSSAVEAVLAILEDSEHF